MSVGDLWVEKTPENLKTIAETSMHSFWNAEPFNISIPEIIDVVLAGDAIGAFYKAQREK